MNFGQMFFSSFLIATLIGCGAPLTLTSSLYSPVTGSVSESRTYAPLLNPRGYNGGMVPAVPPGTGMVNAPAFGMSAMNSCTIQNMTDLVVTKVHVNGMPIPVPILRHGDFFQVQVSQPTCKWENRERVCDPLVIQAGAWDTFELATMQLPTGTGPQYPVRKQVVRNANMACHPAGQPIALLRSDIG